MIKVKVSFLDYDSCIPLRSLMQHSSVIVSKFYLCRKFKRMVAIGRTNTLKVVKEVDFGVYLDGGDLGEVLLPKRYVPSGIKIDQDLDVFIYLDSEDRYIATTEKPLAQVDEFALLEVVAVNKMGAFLNWGLMKDLFVPFREQHERMQVGEKYVVYIMVDPDTDRIMASSKLSFFLNNIPSDFEEGEEVRIQIFEKTEIGYRAIVQDAFMGMLYRNEVFQPLKIGQKLTGYVKKVREDEKLDLTLEKPGYAKIDSIAKQLLQYIQQNGGRIDLTDKSPAEEIYSALQMSKKNFKKAIGNLYKAKHIVLELDHIRLK